MEIAYVAHTEACTFLLDGDGICRSFVAGAQASEATLSTAQRCVGAQYIASLDRDAEGPLIHDPKVGTRLVFAVVKDNGRVALVRSGPLVRFEALEEPMPVAAVTERDLATHAAEDEPDDEQEGETAPFSREIVLAPRPDDTEPPTTRRQASPLSRPFILAVPPPRRSVLPRRRPA
jgi:hypothetical protein